MHFRDVIKVCEGCGAPLRLNNSRDITRKRICGRKCLGNVTSRNVPIEHLQKMWKLGCLPASNIKKSCPGNKNGRWLTDRSKLKNKRLYFEEKLFIKEILQERNFTCELTGQRGGRLSVHHKNGWKDYPEQRFDKSNVVVIQQPIHKLFHNIYGTSNITEAKWEEFVKDKKYAIYQ